MQTHPLSPPEGVDGPTGGFRAAVKNLLSAIPFGNALVRKLLSLGFNGSPSYWEARYAKGDNSGAGSYGELAEFKGQVLRDFIDEQSVHSVIDFGCGDGNQIGYLEETPYVGLDVSATAIELCSQKYAHDSTKRFVHFSPGRRFADLSINQAEMAMSLDVIFHLVEDEVFASYIDNLFSAATRFVVVYSSNTDKLTESPHVRHRNITAHIQSSISGWSLCRHVENPYKGEFSDSDFFIYGRDDNDVG